MTAPAFTPGPWHVTQTVHVDRKNVFGMGDQPFHVGTLVSGSKSKLDQFDANARLIGAAPDLFAELQQFVNGVETGLISSPADETLANITSRAKAALAKARGEQVP